ncbi:hypothetical protein WMY93_028419 [Mugilogobius chulae]|uniref:L1 transposable element RRM domain-containing protein n=1 Tax=Mugilogobius chulae TaxID=88201 RepID=A0AAW0MPB1_9GOBI
MTSLDHDYSQVMSSEKTTGGGKRSAPPTTPNKQQPAAATKKTRSDGEKSSEESATKQILDGITKLSERFDVQEERMNQISDKLEKNCTLVTKLTADVTEYKIKTVKLEQQLAKLNEEVTATKEKCKEQERYKRRWNLRIKGLKEKEKEDVRGIVISLLSQIAPGVPWDVRDMVDSVHRIGRRESQQSRQVIIQFVKRECRNEIWRLTKNCDVCKREGIRFAEDMIPEDRETRKLLWPKIKEARDQNKRAYFRGPFGFIENVQVFP